MLVLAVDTATDAVVVGVVDLPGGDGPPRVLAERLRPGARQHGEQLMPAVLEVCAAAGRTPAELDAVVCGLGPGPFTGLRVGIASAAALADALDVPAHGVCSLDAIAVAVAAGEPPVGPGEPPAGQSPVGPGQSPAGQPPPGPGEPLAEGPREPLLVVTDARRRELYWAAYDTTGARAHGPAVDTPAALAELVPELGVHRVAGTVADEHAALLGLPVHPARVPSPIGLVTVAAAAVRAGAAAGPLEPCYLRRPDAVPPAARKRVTA
ncbi:MAG: tRNA (adenosine(37)-N6)-threonylcarbamoyltransferase complex dimerization subunit type 1 TsaB [Pseudonocardia sp.]